MKYDSIMEHCAQCKEPQTLNLEGKKKKNSKSQETEEHLAKQDQQCSPQGISLLNSAHPFKISLNKKRSTI